MSQIPRKNPKRLNTKKNLANIVYSNYLPSFEQLGLTINCFSFHF